MERNKRPGGSGFPTGPKQSNVLSISKDRLKTSARLPLELLQSLPAREEDIHARVLCQLEGTGLPNPDHIQVLVHQAAGGDVKADCKHMAREWNASVLICDSDGKILAFAWPNENGHIAQLLEYNPEATYTLDQLLGKPQR
jgi:hypothetical protein